MSSILITGAADGLGHLVYLSYIYADMGKIAALAGVYCTCGLLVFWAWRHADDRWAPWSTDSRLERKT